MSVNGPLGREELQAAVIDAIPLHGLLGLSLADTGFAVELPDLAQTRNHLGGQGGAALFGAAEAAGAALVFDLLAPVRTRVFAVPAEATIRFLKPARGGVVATAVLTNDAGQAVDAALDGRVSELSLAVSISDASGVAVGALEARWHLALRRAGGRSGVPG